MPSKPKAATPEPEVLEPEAARDLLPAVREHEAIVARAEISVDEAKAQKDKIVALMDAVMVKDIHYGVIPGVGKPSLFKPGAEAINVALRLAPDYESVETYDGDHLTVKAKCRLSHIPTGLFVAAGEGLCSSKESKYAWRKQKRTCPACGAEAIIKGKAEYGGGWVCWKKADTPGCGANYADDDPAIVNQVEGKVVNPDLPDTWNTVLKMADKRALVAAVLNGTAASDVFTQDVEDQQAARELASQEERRRDGPEPHPIPKGWADIERDIRRVDNGVEAWALFEAFVRAASYHMFGTKEPSSLKGDEKDLLFQKAAGVTVWLFENVEYDGPFFYLDEGAQRRAWTALGVEDLQIPDYVPPEPEPDEAGTNILEEDAPRVPQD